jgi:hypothetical membrane protein
MVCGSALLYQEFKKSLGSRIGFWFMGLAGLGTVLVGVFAENTIGSLHALGAALVFVIGNVGMVLLGRCLDIPKALKIYTVVSGLISLTATFLFATHNYLGIGIGGMERLAVHLQTLWLIIFGLYICKNHFRTNTN